jgi:hypothetical protein
LLVGLALTIWSLGVRGFSGARWSDVPIIKSFVDERLYRRDPFIWALHDGTPAAYAYRQIAAVAALPLWGSLEQAMLALYLPATVLSLALLFRLGLLLTGDRAATLLFLLLYVAGYRLLTVGSAILHSAELTPQVLALPLQLASLYALLRGRTVLAGGLMGLAFNLHTPTTVYLAAALGFYALVSVPRLGARSVALSLGLLLATAAPTIVGALLNHGDQLPLWALDLARAELATDISLATHFASRGVLVYNLVGLALTGLALRAAPSGEGRRSVLLFFGASTLMCLLALVFFDFWLRSPLSTLVARLQFPRSAWIVNLFGLLYLARLLVVGWRANSMPRPLILLLVSGMLAAPVDFLPLDPLLLLAQLSLLLLVLVRRPALTRLGWWLPWIAAPLFAAAGAAGLELRELDFALSLRSAAVFAGLALGWGLWRLLESRSSRPAWAAAVGLAIALTTPVLLEQVERRQYASAHRGGLQAAAEFQDWARSSTPLDSVFLILPSEPNNADFYERAERAVFLVRERANQAVYFRAHNFEFDRRVRALGIEQPLRYREELDPAFRRLTEERVRALAREFGVTHFVPARAGNFSFPIVYQSGGWTVYQVD